MKRTGKENRTEKKIRIEIRLTLLLAGGCRVRDVADFDCIRPEVINGPQPSCCEKA